MSFHIVERLQRIVLENIAFHKQPVGESTQASHKIAFILMKQIAVEQLIGEQKYFSVIFDLNCRNT